MIVKAQNSTQSTNKFLTHSHKLIFAQVLYLCESQRLMEVKSWKTDICLLDGWVYKEGGSWNWGDTTGWEGGRTGSNDNLLRHSAEDRVSAGN